MQNKIKHSFTITSKTQIPREKSYKRCSKLYTYNKKTLKGYTRYLKRMNVPLFMGWKTTAKTSISPSQLTDSTQSQ
jgi:hypothetical protein